MELELHQGYGAFAKPSSTGRWVCRCSALTFRPLLLWIHQGAASPHSAAMRDQSPFLPVLHHLPWSCSLASFYASVSLSVQWVKPVPLPMGLFWVQSGEFFFRVSNFYVKKIPLYVVSVLVSSCYCDQTLWPKATQRRKRQVELTLPGHSLSRGEVRTGTQVVPWRRNHRKYAAWLPYTTQIHRTGNATTTSGWALLRQSTVQTNPTDVNIR